MTSEAIVKAAAAGLVGLVIGWTANALTLSGRVDAIEAGQHRIESRLDQLIEKQREHRAEVKP